MVSCWDARRGSNPGFLRVYQVWLLLWGAGSPVGDEVVSHGSFWAPLGCIFSLFIDLHDLLIGHCKAYIICILSAMARTITYFI